MMAQRQGTPQGGSRATGAPVEGRPQPSRGRPQQRHVSAGCTGGPPRPGTARPGGSACTRRPAHPAPPGTAHNALPASCISAMQGLPKPPNLGRLPAAAAKRGTGKPALYDMSYQMNIKCCIQERPARCWPLVDVGHGISPAGIRAFWKTMAPWINESCIVNNHAASPWTNGQSAN